MLLCRVCGKHGVVSYRRAPDYREGPGIAHSMERGVQQGRHQLLQLVGDPWSLLLPQALFPSKEQLLGAEWIQFCYIGCSGRHVDSGWVLCGAFPGLLPRPLC